MATETTANLDKAIDQLNSLLRGEISAVETYTQASRKIEDDRAGDAALLRGIEQEHGRNAQLIREEVKKRGGDADNSSGAWGAWAKTVERVATLFGDPAALKALKEGEEHGLKDYRDALEKLDGSARELVERLLIPAQQRHIALLDELIAKSGKGTGMMSPAPVV
jgi:uncharacterized protein (TIGR02284 family)